MSPQRESFSSSCGLRPLRSLAVFSQRPGSGGCSPSTRRRRNETTLPHNLLSHLRLTCSELRRTLPLPFLAERRFSLFASLSSASGSSGAQSQASWLRLQLSPLTLANPPDLSVSPSRSLIRKVMMSSAVLPENRSLPPSRPVSLEEGAGGGRIDSRGEETSSAAQTEAGEEGEGLESAVDGQVSGCSRDIGITRMERKGKEGRREVDEASKGAR